MSILKDIKTKVTKKKNEKSRLDSKKNDLLAQLQEVESKILEAELYVRHHEEFISTLEKEERKNSEGAGGFTKNKPVSRNRPLTKDSDPYLAYKILQERGERMHLDDILAEIFKKYRREIKKRSLQSSVNAHARSGRFFRAHRGNIFSAIQDPVLNDGSTTGQFVRIEKDPICSNETSSRGKFKVV